jgi:adenylate cyclase
MSDLPGKGLWNQLRKRKVIHVALIYALAAWLLIHLSKVFQDGSGSSHWFLNMLIGLVFLGFPVVVILSWIYELTPRGIRKNSAGYIESITRLLDEQDVAPSIAVLPFADISTQRDQSSFCEGFAEEILNDLYRFTRLRVVPRVAAFQFDPEPPDLSEPGRKLCVQTVLNGSIAKSGDKLDVTAELVSTDDGSTLWSYRFDGMLEDIFDIQEEIAQSITKVLGGRLRKKRQLRKRRTEPKAHDLFLRALSHFARHTTQENAHARQLLRQAIDIDPNYGRAWAGFAYTYVYEYM